MRTIMQLSWVPFFVAACSSTTASGTNPPDPDGGSSSSSTSGTTVSASASQNSSGTPVTGTEADGGCLCNPATQYKYDYGTNAPICIALPSWCVGDSAACADCIGPPQGQSPRVTACQATKCGFVLTASQ